LRKKHSDQSKSSRKEAAVTLEIWVVRQTGSARRPRSSVPLAAPRQRGTIL